MIERQARRQLLTGFLLAVVLTAIPFALAATQVLPGGAALFVIALLAPVQIAVHVRYFLRPGRMAAGRQAVPALIFTALVIFIMIGGSLWIMFDLQQRMMPG